MNAIEFLDKLFMMAALGEWAQMLDKEHAISLDDRLPQEGRAAYEKALAAKERPVVSEHPEHGLFVTHNFDFEDGNEDEDDDRMVCWAGIGPEALSKVAGRWIANPAMPDPPPEVTPEPKPPKETELGPWSREMSVSMVSAVLDCSIDVDDNVKTRLEDLIKNVDEMSDWDLWVWLDQVNLWYFQGLVSGMVKAACWPRPFYRPPERPTPAPDSKVWAYTWSARPYTTSVVADEPLGEAQALVMIEATEGRIPVGLALWPCSEDGAAL